MNNLPATSFRVVTVIAILNPDGSVLDYLTDIMVGGSVTIDTTAENLRTCSFSCLDPGGLLSPVGSGGLLAPDGVEVQILTGYIVDGSTTLFSQGIFRVIETDVVSGSTSGTPGPVLNVTGTDLSIKISGNLFDNAFAIAAGTNVTSAVFDILAQQAPWCTITNFVVSTATVAAQSYQPGDDPWQAIQEIFASAGLLTFFDREGVLCSIVDPSSNPTQPTGLFIDGAASTITSITRVTSNSPGYNGVIVTGQSLSGSSAVISGSAYDANPQSPTYYLGAYGKVPAPPVQVSTVTTNAAASSMAQALLPQVLGLTLQVAITTVPCFWLDAFDLIYVANVATQTQEVLILEQATVPLDYSQLESITGVPLGTPISQFDGLSNSPSVAAYAPTSTGAFNYNPTTGTYTYGSVSTGSGISTGGLGGLGGFGAIGGFGLGGGIFSPGAIVGRILRAGNGNYNITRDAQGVESIVMTAE